MSPKQWAELVEQLNGLGKRVSVLERTVFSAMGGVAVVAFLLANHMLKLH